MTARKQECGKDETSIISRRCSTYNEPLGLLLGTFSAYVLTFRTRGFEPDLPWQHNLRKCTAISWQQPKASTTEQAKIRSNVQTCANSMPIFKRGAWSKLSPTPAETSTPSRSKTPAPNQLKHAQASATRNTWLVAVGSCCGHTAP